MYTQKKLIYYNLVKGIDIDNYVNLKHNYIIKIFLSVLIRFNFITKNCYGFLFGYRKSKNISRYAKEKHFCDFLI